MTRIAIATTTIFTPSVLASFVKDARDAKVDFRLYIAGDRKTPDLSGLAKELGPETKWIPASAQNRWKTSGVLRWNCIQRRNIAFLEAWAEGPFDFYLSIDDDNAPQESYFRDFLALASTPARSRVHPAGTWFNYFQGASIDPKLTIFARGYPIHERNEDRGKGDWSTAPAEISPERIAAFQGLSLGDPDADAFTHIVAHPRVHEFAFRSAVSQGAWSPINSQNTFVREAFLPLFPMFDRIGRFDDIMAGYLLQHFAYENGGAIHFGAPFTRQERGKRDWLRDMGMEMEGHATCEQVLARIREIPCKGLTPHRWMKKLFLDAPPAPEFFPRHAPLVAAWLEDLDAGLANRRPA